MMEILKAKKVFMKVTETAKRKGIETYCDTVALANFNPVYKGQLISAMQTALELLIGEPIMITTVRELDGQREHSGSGETHEIVDQSVQQPMPQVQSKNPKSKN